MESTLKDKYGIHLGEGGVRRDGEVRWGTPLNKISRGNL